MRSIVDVTVAATNRNLTTLAAVKRDQGITDTTSDTVLADRLRMASAEIEAYLNWPLARETVSETIRFDPFEAPECAVLRRIPVVSIASVTADSVALDASRYEVDKESGELFALDGSGGRCIWYWRTLVVVYTAGFILPGTVGANLPGDIERACIALTGAWHAAAGRDPAVRSEQILDVYGVSYFDSGNGGTSTIVECLDKRRIIPV